MSITPPDSCPLTQAIAWLEQLYEKQKKGLLNPDFSIHAYLCYEKMPSYRTIISSESQLCVYAATLFSAELNTIQLIKKRFVAREHCSEVTFDIAGETAVFYIKRAWEGAIKEAIGLEFNNLLTDTPIRYLCGDEVIMTEKVFEPLPTDTLYELRDSKKYIFAYGAWEIFSQVLGLTDRKTTNVRWNGERLANIDFGLVFYKGKPVFDSRFTLTETSPLRQQGQIYATEFLLSRFQQQQEKLAQLLLNLDVHFCRNTPCSRTPREPIRIILAALQAIDPAILEQKSSHAEEKLILPTVPVSHLTRELNTYSALTALFSISGVLYAAILNNDGMILDEVESAKYRSDYTLTNQHSQALSVNPVLNPHLLDLIIKGRHIDILKTDQDCEQSESIQIDLTSMRLLVIWNKHNQLMALSLLELDVAVAHIKVTMRKAIESFSLTESKLP